MPPVRCCFLVLLAGLLVQAARAQQPSWEIGGGAGLSEPTHRIGNDLDTGWDFDIRGGYRPLRNLFLDLDFNFNRWNLNSTALARYGEPGGYTTIWSVSFTPEYRGPGHWNFRPYVFGGPGLYYRNLSLTTPGLVNTFYCDPYFGFCYPATVGVNQVVASFTTYKMGVNGGAGVEYRIGQSHFKVFGEARYSRMFTTHGNDISFVPVTFGVRW